MENLEKAATKPKFNMYNDTFDGVSGYIKDAANPVMSLLDE